jgi:Nucleotidyl transferase AbiEii toxin, Type IV TA system
VNIIHSLNDCLNDLERAFSRARWCLIGAQAAIIYGSTRMTQDIDVSLSIEPSQWPELLDQLLHNGFEARIKNALEFAGRTRVLLVRHNASKIPVDIILAGPGLEEMFLDRAKLLTVFDKYIKVISPEDLIASKLLAGRPNDLFDVSAIIRRNLNLDTNMIEQTLSLLEQALDRSDLIPLFRRAKQIEPFEASDR